MDARAAPTTLDPPTPPRRTRAVREFDWTAPVFLAAMLAGVAVLWFGPLRTSLGMDETGTYWVIKRGVARAIDRAAEIQGQSPLYYLITLAVRRVAGTSEAALRFPSVVAAAACVFFVYRIGRRLFDRDAALIAATVTAVVPGVTYAAADARPYALALAASTACTLALLRWLESSRAADRVLYVLAGALTVYAHYLFALTLVSHVVYVVALHKRGVPARKMAVNLAFMGILAVPLVPQLLSLLHRSESLSWTGRPQLQSILLVLAQPVIVVAAGYAIRHLRNGQPLLADVRERGLILLCVWATAAPIVTYLISKLTSTTLFDPKYFVSAVPALGLLVGWALYALQPRIIGVTIACVIVCASISTYSGTHVPDDWRNAVRAANAVTPSRDTPVLVHSLFIEARQTSWLTDPEKRDFLMAPAGYYRFAGTIVPLPFNVVGEDGQYVDHIVGAELTGVDRFVLVTNFIHVFGPYIEERVRADGFSRRVVGNYGQLRVTIFERVHR
jgi:hypothetical protein